VKNQHFEFQAKVDFLIRQRLLPLEVNSCSSRKFHGYLREKLKEEVGYSTLVRWLHDNGFLIKVPQPWPDRQDEQKRATFI
jgi:hypothetical protein